MTTTLSCWTRIAIYGDDGIGSPLAGEMYVQANFEFAESVPEVIEIKLGGFEPAAGFDVGAFLFQCFEQNGKTNTTIALVDLSGKILASYKGHFTKLSIVGFDAGDYEAIFTVMETENNE